MYLSTITILGTFSITCYVSLVEKYIWAWMNVANFTFVKGAETPNGNILLEVVVVLVLFRHSTESSIAKAEHLAT